MKTIPIPRTEPFLDFDDIGNRISTKVGGDNDGWNLRPANYTVTALNQYTNRTVSGTVDVIGIADARAAVTVNNQTAERKVEYYHLGLALSNSTALYPSITNKATYGTTSTTTGHVFIPATPEYFNHDADGNLTSDGRWKYTWDAENRLTAMESITNGTPSASWRKLAFVYDAQGRRIRKTVQIGNTNATWGAVIFDNLYVYNGWNLMVELNATNKAIINSYMWGADVSGTEQGAGGVGGLLKIYRPGAADNFTVYDANGNLTALVDGSYGTVSANYEYGPFGEVIRATGPTAKVNAFRFSSKYQDDESDLVYYGYRYYSPSTGRWISRDPIAESGGFNLYSMVCNATVNGFDVLGLDVGDAKHTKGKCSSSMTCRENLQTMFSFQAEIALRLRNDFTENYRRWAIQGREIPPSERYNPKITNNRDSWNNHREQLKTSVRHFSDCVTILTAQYRDRQCRCCKRLDDKRLKWLGLEAERYRSQIPEEIRQILVRPITIPPSAPAGAPAMSPDGQMGVIPTRGYGSPGPEVALVGLNIMALGIALCDGPEPGPADALALEFLRRAGVVLAP